MDMLCEAASKGGNLLLNVGPDGDGRLPSPFLESTSLIGAWLKRNGEAIYRTQAADVTQFVTQGYQTQRDNVLYLILRFWHEGLGEVRLPHLATPILDARWLDTDQPLQVRREPHAWVIRTPPRDVPPPGYPVIRVTCDGPPQSPAAGRQRLWSGDPATHLPWVGRRPEPPWHVGSSQP
jgi:alpha-L-fucosidase